MEKVGLNITPKEFASKVIPNSDKKIGFIFFEQLSSSLCEKFKNFNNVIPIKAEVSNTFKDSLKDIDKVVTFETIGKTPSKQYKLVKAKSILIHHWLIIS